MTLSASVLLLDGPRAGDTVFVASLARFVYVTETLQPCVTPNQSQAPHTEPARVMYEIMFLVGRFGAEFRVGMVDMSLDPMRLLIDGFKAPPK